MILDLRHIFKDYTQDKLVIPVLKDVSLQVDKGEYVAIMGPSGSGKTTLMNIIGCLDHPTSGSYELDGQNVLGLKDRALSDLRLNSIGFVFQSFHLMPRETALENVALPLSYAGVGKRARREAAKKALDRVGLSDRVTFKPTQLSGGQKQRVAIARALASDPKILLCDEATSALDPQTTASILELLKSINEQFNITIVIITHQMSVIREICNRVAIIEHGELVENGLVEDIFSHPKSKAARELILRDLPEDGVKLEGAVAEQLERIQSDRKLRIVFSENSAFEPVIANMILKFGTPVNILRADTKNVGGVAKGEMILGLPDDRHLQIDMEEYLKEHGLEIEEVTGDVE